ncbi:MAG: hypothetical protein U0164_01760 [Gemmatimonadaceae bacterium]
MGPRPRFALCFQDVGLKPFLAFVGIFKNTYFLRERHEPTWIALLHLDEDRDHRLHFPYEAGE